MSDWDTTLKDFIFNKDNVDVVFLDEIHSCIQKIL